MGAITLAAISFFLVSRWSGEWVRNELLTISGADQFFIFRARFFWLAVVVAALWAVMFVQQLRKPIPDSLARSLPFHLYVLNALAVVLLPFSIIPPGYTERFSFISPRLSLMAAAFACVCVAIDKPARWMCAAVWLLALLFFCFLFTDMRQLNKVEARVDELLRTIPPGQRITALIYYPRARLRELHHMLDRQCIAPLLYEFPHSGETRRRPTDPSPLSVREVDALRGLAEGKVYKQIARELSLSVSTIRTHLHNVYRKIGAVDRAQAVLIARDRGWL
jgi:DNA-binding CsgD family transcriptional regulator